MPFWKRAPKAEPNSEGSAPTSRSQQERQADEDLAAILREFSSPPSSSTSFEPSSPASPSIPTKATPPEEEEALKESLNCLRAFDELFYCYSLGGQFLNVYRYGQYRDCGEKTDDWLFCLRAKVRGGGNNPSTREMVLARNREKAAARYGTGPSSEDVWSQRKTPLVDAFSGGDVNRVPGGVLD